MVIGLKGTDEPRPLVAPKFWEKLVLVLHDAIDAFLGLFKRSGTLLTLLAEHVHISKRIQDDGDDWVECIAVDSEGSLRFRRRPRFAMVFDSVFGETCECDGQLRPLKGRESHVKVAVKRLLPVMLEEGISYDDATDQLQKRLRREVEIVSKLKHPNLAPILGYFEGSSLDNQCLVTLWYPNGTLSSWAETNRSWEEKSKSIEGLANGLSYLSSEKVVHGDLRPLNILMDDQCNPIISDFGLSSAWTEGCGEAFDEVRSTARFSDFIRWISLERLELHDISLADDVYAFGCIVLFILTNEVPYYTALSEMEFWNQRSNYNPSSPNVHPALSLKEGSTWRKIMDKCWLPAEPPDDEMESKEYRPRMKLIHDMVKQTIYEDPTPKLNEPTIGLKKT